ncbi:TPR_REGION domain-containing protein [Tenacibaculum sp. 190130A14a]|uniref:TPR_REGION domain-containing protein n=1 Tax=Tenacibaculum polynesiense TaxID=3137857 RepID=A0ABM9PCA1_9FLAO
MKLLKIIGILFIMLLNIRALNSQILNNKVVNPIEYFKERERAVQLVKNKQWLKAVQLLENLTSQYQNDGDLYYLLGTALFQTKAYSKSIIAFKACLDKGGTVLKEILTGSSPSNDIMIKISKAYALNKDKPNMLKWLKMAFESRYDEKPFLSSISAFKAYENDDDFKKLIGTYKNEKFDRKAAWIEDINYFIKNIKQTHYKITGTTTIKLIDELADQMKSNIDQLTDQQIVAKLMKVLGYLGNGHNLIIPTTLKQNALKQLPMQFYVFEDGMFVVNAKKEYKEWIGHKVVSIEGTPVKEALSRTNLVNARDNDMQISWLGPYYLSLPDVLKELNLVKSSKEVTLLLKNRAGITKELKLKPRAWNFYDFPKLPELNEEVQPLYLSRQKDIYWHTSFAKQKVLYLQFNAVANKKEESIKDYAARVSLEIEKKAIEHLILDIRFNHGGNGSLLKPLIKMILNFEITHPKGKIFIIMGRETFSAAQNLLTEITKYTNAILVGEPSGSSPNHIGEANWFKLPYSGLMGLVSSQFHQTSSAEDHRHWIAPHVPIAVKGKDYFEGKDKALKTILELIATLK